jgi:hypothetical protein
VSTALLIRPMAENDGRGHATVELTFREEIPGEAQHSLAALLAEHASRQEGVLRARVRITNRDGTPVVTAQRGLSR